MFGLDSSGPPDSASYYDSIADSYDELHKQEQEKKLDRIRSALNVKPGQSLLDVGCGTGISTRSWHCQRTGIDPSQKLISIAKEKDPQGKYLVGFAESLPFDDNSFDVVISVSAIHNFNDIFKGLKEIKRVGKNIYALSVLRRSHAFRKASRIILANFQVYRIIKENQDVIFLCSI